jgi:hypothetical protein
MIPFYSRLPELAAHETRGVVILPGQLGVPVGHYAFVEFYCEEEDCDCRRVLLQVWKSDRPGVVLATAFCGAL